MGRPDAAPLTFRSVCRNHGRKSRVCCGMTSLAAAILIELFTSEGCSSCPPADAVLARLHEKQPLAGVQLIVLSEHVDYWDDLGWKDTYSSHAITLRQQTYARRLHVAGPYTPQMVVDGSFEFVGSDRRRATHAFEQASSLPKLPVRIT